jgi:hypothetical protein
MPLSGSRRLLFRVIEAGRLKTRSSDELAKNKAGKK